MRGDLETAMGVALTSRSACDLLLDAPDEFGASFGLAPDEIGRLAAMADDLADLMGGFVTKRERGLRRALWLTMKLLGDAATPMVETFSDTHPCVESMAADILSFADFLVSEIPVPAHAVEHALVIVDVARLERLRHRSFSTLGPLWPVPETAPLDPLHIDGERPLTLHRSAVTEEFGWDLRSIRSLDGVRRLRPDPCVLLCFQWGPDGGGRTLRLDDETSRALEAIAARPGAVTGSEVCRSIGTERSPQVLLGKLIAQGVVRGSGS